jgi:hypothetical protein
MDDHYLSEAIIDDRKVESLVVGQRQTAGFGFRQCFELLRAILEKSAVVIRRTA